MPADATTFSSIIRLPMSLAPKNSASWPIFSPCVTHDDWMFGMLSRYSRAMACVRRYSNEPAGGHVGHAVWLGLERPADERREAAGLVLQLPQAVEVLDALGERLDVAEHHRAGRAAAELVPDAVHFEPFVGQHLFVGDRLADAIDEDLAAAARQAAHAGVLEPLQHLAQRQLVELVEVPDFRRAEGVQVDLRDSAPSDRGAAPRTIRASATGALPPCIRIWSPPRAIVSSIFWYSSSRGRT